MTGRSETFNQHEQGHSLSDETSDSREDGEIEHQL